MKTLIVYEGYALEERRSGGFRSLINGEIMVFDRPSDWARYINQIKSTKNESVQEKKHHPHQ